MEFRQIDMSYKNSADEHFINAKTIYESASSFKDIIYAALELRFCIERLSFQYLLLLTHHKREMSKNEIKLYKPLEIFKRVEKEEPLFCKMIDFANAVAKVRKFPYTIVYPEINWLITVYGRIGDYLHCQKEEFTEERKTFLVDLVKECLEKLKSHIAGQGHIYNLGDHAQFIFDKYCMDDIDKEQMQKMVEIADMPDHMYNQNKKKDE